MEQEFPFTQSADLFPAYVSSSLVIVNFHSFLGFSFVRNISIFLDINIFLPMRYVNDALFDFCFMMDVEG